MKTKKNKTVSVVEEFPRSPVKVSNPAIVGKRRERVPKKSSEGLQSRNCKEREDREFPRVQSVHKLRT